MSTRVVLIRHGQPLNHCEGEPERMSGWTDFPLSDEGRRQAASLARRLEAERARFTALYASPLQRAADTARAIAGRCDANIELVDDLREIGCGCVDGMPIPEVQRDYADCWHANLLQNDEDFRWPGGESYRELRERCLRSLCTLAARHAGHRIALVTHAGVISQVIGHMNGLTPARWECFRPGHCSVTEVEWAGRSGRLLTFDDRVHLQGIESEDHRLDSA